MQIVIEIPEERYEKYKRIGDSRDILFEAIRNGTVLPKHHGDLIDRNELLKTPMDLSNFPSNYVKIAPTIIEATDIKGGEQK